LKTHLGGFDLVPRRAAPALQIREDFAFLSVEARVHLTPPLLLHDGGWWRTEVREEGEEVRRVSGAL